MKLKWQALLTAFMLLAAAGMAGCGNSSDNANGKIVFASHDAPSNFVGQIYDGVTVKAQQMGLEVELKNAGMDSNNQIDQLKEAIEQKPKAIILLPMDGTSIVPTVEKVNDAKIPLITTNRNLNGGQFAEVMYDEYQAGQLQGEYMAKNLPQGAKVVYLMGEPSLEVSQQRWLGFKEACLDKRPDIELLAKAKCDWSEAQGVRNMAMWLKVFPKIDAVVSANDNMAIGAIKAMKAAGRNQGVLVCGCDATNDALKAIAAGDMVMTVEQNADKTVDAIMELIQKALKGEQSTEKVKVPYTEINKSNVANYIK